MVGIDTGLEIVLVGLLGTTLLHAIRLQRALAALRHDKAAMDAAIAVFDGGAREMEAGVARLRDAAERVDAQMRHAGSVRDDLAFLSERGDSLADRLDALVRAGRPLAPAPVADTLPAPPPVAPTRIASEPERKPAQVRSQAERSLLLALQGHR